jgi:hypothetical protein
MPTISGVPGWMAVTSAASKEKTMEGKENAARVMAR